MATGGRGWIWRLLRGSACGVLFLCALVGTCQALKHWVPERKDIPVISEKLEALATKGAEVDTLFIGTSRVYHQVDPQVFDARMAELGRPTHSYNLAADGMNFPETFYVLERALKMTPRLKLVVLEAGSMQHVDNQIFAEGSLRSVHWRDFTRTWMIIRSILRSESRKTQPVSDWTGKIWHQLELLAVNTANLGYGSDLLTRWIYGKSPTLERPLSSNGYAPIQRRISKSDLGIFRERMKTKKPPGELPLRADPELQEQLNQLVTELRSRGVETCFVFLPAFRRDRPEVPSLGLKTIDFDNPAIHPDFFREEYYYDTAHLNETGSRIFTRVLADSVQATHSEVHGR